MLRLLLAEKACVPQTQMLSQLQTQGGVSQAMLAASAGMPASAGLNHEAALQVRHRVTWSDSKQSVQNTCCESTNSTPTAALSHKSASSQGVGMHTCAATRSGCCATA